MLLSSLHLFISFVNFNGILKMSLIKEFHYICITFELYEILTTDPQILSTVQNNCYQDPNNENLTRTIDTKLKWNKKLISLTDVEIIDQQFQHMSSFDLSNNIFHKTTLFNEITINLTTMQNYRLYNFVHSFCVNYSILNSLIKLTLNNIDEKDSKNTKISNTRVVETIQQNQVIQEDNTPECVIQEDVQVDKLLDNIFSLIKPTMLKSVVVNYILTSFQKVNIDENINTSNGEGNKLIIESPNLLRYLYNCFSIDYFRNVVLSLKTEDNNEISFLIRKLFDLYLSKTEEIKNSAVYFLSINYILIVYMLKLLLETYPNYFANNTLKIVSDCSIQTKIVNHLINTMFNEYTNKIYFNITDKDFAVLDKSAEEDLLLQDISNRYKHLIKVSQKEFADLVFKESNDAINKLSKFDLHINSKKIIDINNVMLINKNITDNINNETIIYDLLNYKLNFADYNNKITYSYFIITKYIEDPKILLICDKKLIPDGVYKLIPLITKNLTANIFSEEDTSTLSYYKKILDFLPEEMIYNNSQLILFIVFQIILPYYYHQYKVTKFIDCLI